MPEFKVVDDDALHLNEREPIAETSYAAPRVFHRDGCTGLVVDQMGNEP
jgi:hypothetical protein